MGSARLIIAIASLLGLAGSAHACGYYYAADHNPDHGTNVLAPFFVSGAILFGYLIARLALPRVKPDHASLFVFVSTMAVGVLIPTFLLLFSLDFMIKVVGLTLILFVFLWLFEYSMNQSEGGFSRYISASVIGMVTYLALVNYLPFIKPDATFGLNTSPAVAAVDRPSFAPTTQNISERARRRIQNKMTELPENLKTTEDIKPTPQTPQP